MGGSWLSPGLWVWGMCGVVHAVQRQPAINFACSQKEQEARPGQFAIPEPLICYRCHKSITLPTWTELNLPSFCWSAMHNVMHTSTCQITHEMIPGDTPTKVRTNPTRNIPHLDQENSGGGLFVTGSGGGGLSVCVVQTTTQTLFSRFVPPFYFSPLNNSAPPPTRPCGRHQWCCL